MKRVEKIASAGCKLTQVGEVDVGHRVYASRVHTSRPELWVEVPISEFEEWKKEMEKLNPRHHYDSENK